MVGGGGEDGDGDDDGDGDWISRAMWPMGRKEVGGEGGVRGSPLNVIAESARGSDSRGNWVVWRLWRWSRVGTVGRTWRVLVGGGWRGACDGEAYDPLEGDGSLSLSFSP